jgi:transketolase
MFAGHHRLDNLVAIVDRNRLSATDFTENILTLEPLAHRWKAFGWDVVSVDGHSFEDLVEVFSQVRHRSSLKPLAVIANTIKGRGVSFMEVSPNWHHRLPKGDEVQAALQELHVVLKEAEDQMIREHCDAG